MYKGIKPAMRYTSDTYKEPSIFTNTKVKSKDRYRITIQQTLGGSKEFPIEMYELPGIRVPYDQILYHYNSSNQKLYKKLYSKEFILKALDDKNLEVRLEAVTFGARIDDTDIQEKIREIIIKAIERDTINSRKMRIKAIELGTRLDDKAFVKIIILKALDDDHSWKMRMNAVEHSAEIDDTEIQEKRREVILKALELKANYMWKKRLKAIELGAKIDDTEFVKIIILKALDDNDNDVQMKAVEYGAGIDNTEIQEKIRKVILKALNDKNFEEKLKGVELGAKIDDTEIQEKIREVILKALELKANYMLKVRLKAVELGAKIDDTEFVKIIILKALDDNDNDVQMKAVELGAGIDDKDFVKKIINKAINDYDNYVKLKAIELGTWIDDTEIQNKIRKNIQKILVKKKDKISSHNSLYEHCIEHDHFGEKLKKDHSDTILIDKIPGFPDSYKGKFIIRIIQLEHFLAWKKAYEDFEGWKKLGFNYVPIEPILKFSLQNDFTVKVYTGVLDNDIRALDIPRDKRLEPGLEGLGIYHGHLHHDGNICTWFEKDRNGKPILTKVPRQYIIDFDMATEE